LFWQLMAASPTNFERELGIGFGKIAGLVVQAQSSFTVVPKLLNYNDLRCAIEFEKVGNLANSNRCRTL
jgi:hypothetical protein